MSGNEPKCSTCGGGGYIRAEEEGIMRRCPECDARDQKRYCRDASNLTEAELAYRLEKTFKPMPGKQEALKLARRILGVRTGLFTFHGNYGTGKTTLLKTICAEFVDVGQYAHYKRVADILGEIRRTFDYSDEDRRRCRREGRGSNAEEILEHYSNTSILALDEVDRVKLTDWAQEIIFRLMDNRYQLRETHMTLLALNKDPENLPGELGYLASRMRGGVVLKLGGDDMRPALGVKLLEHYSIDRPTR